MLTKILVLALTSGLAVKAYRSWLQRLPSTGRQRVSGKGGKATPALGAPAKSARAAKAVKAVKSVKATQGVSRLNRSKASGAGDRQSKATKPSPRRLSVKTSSPVAA